MTTHIGFCEKCYTSHVGRSYVVIHCSDHGGGSYVVPMGDDEYDDDDKTLDDARTRVEGRAR